MSDLYGYMENWRKAKNGQIFTPLHMGELAARLIDINENDTVLDAACGSGALLYAAYNQGCKNFLGVEYDPEVKKLADENFSDLPDVTFEIIEGDSQSEEVSNWIKEKKPTKVLLNPPYERKYGCMKIVKNVVDALEPGTKVAIFLPDKKFEKESKKYQKQWKEHHTIDKIIKMPTNLFYGFSVETSIFIITAGTPQPMDIYTCFIEDDGLVTMKNQSPQDIKGTWENDKKDRYFTTIIEEDTDGKTANEIDAKYIDSDKHLSYQVPPKPFQISEYDFVKTAMDYICFKNNINIKDYGFTSFTPKVIQILEQAKVGFDLINYYKTNMIPDVECEIKLSDYFEEIKPNGPKLDTSYKELPEGNTPLIGGGIVNNGITKFCDVQPQYQGNCITVNCLNGRAFYHNYPFSKLGHAVYVLKPTQPIPPLACAYLVTLISKKFEGQYDFSNRLQKRDVLDLRIPVPAKKDEPNEPDFTCMAMKQLQLLNQPNGGE